MGLSRLASRFPNREAAPSRRVSPGESVAFRFRNGCACVGAKRGVSWDGTTERGVGGDVGRGVGPG